MPLSYDSALARIHEFVRALPDMDVAPDETIFSVQGKRFAHFLSNYLGDPRTVVVVRAFSDDDATTHIHYEPEHYCRVRYFPRDWVGLVLDDRTDWNLVGERLGQSWDIARRH